MTRRGRHGPWPCQAPGKRAARRYTGWMAKRDPHDVLGVEAGASATQIKAAWRRLARANHPDLTGDDPAASRRRHAPDGRDQRRLRGPDPHRAIGPAADGRRPDGDAPFDPSVARRRGGPPAPKPTRPVTGRVDMSGTYRPRNQAVGNPLATASRCPGSRRSEASRVGREPPRASTPTGPLVARPAPPLPPAAAADRSSDASDTSSSSASSTTTRSGQIAAFEPSYIDWVAGRSRTTRTWWPPRGSSRPISIGAGSCAGSARPRRAHAG